MVVNDSLHQSSDHLFVLTRQASGQEIQAFQLPQEHPYLLVRDGEAFQSLLPLLTLQLVEPNGIPNLVVQGDS